MLIQNTAVIKLKIKPVIQNTAVIKIKNKTLTRNDFRKKIKISLDDYHHTK